MEEKVKVDRSQVMVIGHLKIFSRHINRNR